MSSHANASNVRLRWMFPNNLKFQTLNQSVGPKISIEVYSSYFDVQVRNLMLTLFLVDTLSVLSCSSRSPVRGILYWSSVKVTSHDERAF